MNESITVSISNEHHLHIRYMALSISLFIVIVAISFVVFNHDWSLICILYSLARALFVTIVICAALGQTLLRPYSIIISQDGITIFYFFILFRGISVIPRERLNAVCYRFNKKNQYILF